MRPIARHNLPFAQRGQRIGLLGGSFDPAHTGHAHITREALRRFGLDAVWWLVTPGNPLKAHGPAPLAQRMAQARQVMRHPRVKICDIERHLQARFTADTLRHMQRLYPGVHFLWLMGADNLAQLHRWQNWQDIVQRVPLGVLARPGQQISGQVSKAAQVYSHARLSGNAAKLLARRGAPGWCFVNVPMRDISSSDLRAKTGWGTAG